MYLLKIRKDEITTPLQDKGPPGMFPAVFNVLCFKTKREYCLVAAQLLEVRWTQKT